MNLKRSYLLCIAALLTVQAATAQDKIYRRNGKVIEAKIKEVGIRNITFKRYDNQQGPDFTIGRNDVRRIVFENGSEENMSRFDDHRVISAEERKERAKEESGYGRNIISIAPIQFTNTSVTGVGLHYERQLDRRGVFHFYLPLVYSFRTEENYNYNTGKYDHNMVKMFWTYPGIKFYPAGSQHRVTYSVGPSLAIGTGQQPVSRTEFNPVTGYNETTYHNENVFRMGLVVNNGLNIQPTSNFYIGLELGLGIPYIYNTSSDNSTSSNVGLMDEPMVQFNFKLGYRF